MSLFKCLFSFLLLLTLSITACNNIGNDNMERPQPIKTKSIKRVEINAPALIKPVGDTIQDTLKHYHQETNKSIDTKYLKKSFNLHKKPFVA